MVLFNKTWNMWNTANSQSILHKFTW